VRASRPSLNHIFHEPLIVEEFVTEPVIIEPIKIVETAAPKKKTPPIIFADSKPRVTEKVVEVIEPVRVIEPIRMAEPVRVVEPARYVQPQP